MALVTTDTSLSRHGVVDVLVAFDQLSFLFSMKGAVACQEVLALRLVLQLGSNLLGGPEEALRHARVLPAHYVGREGLQIVRHHPARPRSRVVAVVAVVAAVSAVAIVSFAVIIVVIAAALTVLAVLVLVLVTSLPWSASLPAPPAAAAAAPSARRPLRRRWNRPRRCPPLLVVVVALPGHGRHAVVVVVERVALVLREFLGASLLNKPIELLAG